MINSVWHLLFLDPIYNGLVFFIEHVPMGDVGLAIIATTVVVKLLLLPLSIKAARTQKIVRDIQPKLDEIKETLKDDRQAQAQATLALYREHGLNPMASILLLFVQIPVIIALYFAVSGGGGVKLPEVNSALLYSFIPTPGAVNMLFLGIADITQKSMILALLAGVTQFIHARLAFPAPEAPAQGVTPDFKADFARSMNLQMRYVMPVIIGVVAYSFAASLALYFTVSNIMAIAQEFVVRKHR